MASKVLFSNLGNSPKDKIINIVIIIVVLVAFIILFKKYAWTPLKNALNKRKAEKEVENEIKDGGKLTYKDADYLNFANQLYTAMKGFGTTTSVVYSVFNQMQSKADVLMLIAKFGIRDGEDLATWMRGETILSIKSINTTLAQKGINYAF